MVYFLRCVSLIVLSGILLGCATRPDEPQQAAGATPTATAEPTETVALPTVTPIPQVTPTEGVSQAALEAMWRLPIVVSALNYSICIEAQRSLVALQAGEAEGAETTARLRTLESFINVVDEELTVWEPSEAAVLTFKSSLEENAAAVGETLSAWLMEEMGDTAAAEALEAACATADTTGETVSEQAVRAGFSPTALQTLLEEVQMTLAVALAAEVEIGEEEAEEE